MENNQLKALLMAVMAPNGTAINMNEQMLKFLSTNADNIMGKVDKDIDALKKKGVEEALANKTVYSAKDYELAYEKKVSDNAPKESANVTS